MKDLFIKIFDLADFKGDITEAIMYEGGTFAKVKFVTEDGTYTLSISKENTNGNDGN